MKLKRKRSEYFSVKPKLAGSQGFFGQLPDDGREFGKGNPGFWICLCFVYWAQGFISQMNSFFIVMVVIMKILLVISSVKVPWQNGL